MVALADCVKAWLADAPISDWRVVEETLGMRLNRAYLMHKRYGELGLMNPHSKIGVFEDSQLTFYTSLITYAPTVTFNAADPSFFDLLGAFLEKYK